MVPSWPKFFRKCELLPHFCFGCYHILCLLIIIFHLLEFSRDGGYFSDAWISRIKPEVGDNWRLKVTISFSFKKIFDVFCNNNVWYY